MFAATSYALYWQIVYRGLAAIAWPLVVLLPVQRWRWPVLHGLCRAALRLMALPLTLEGLDTLPAEDGILVVNHSSYLDSLVLSAVVPGNLAFVAKKELAGGHLSGPFLARLGTVFVDRLDARSALADASAATGLAVAGRRLVFFPEGTFTRMPGLLPFHLGAFHVAARTGRPIVPIALRGTRSILRGDTWFARRGPVKVHVGPPLYPDGTGFDAAVRLRAAARTVILSHCGEPDLADERILPPTA
jgi:1-acyl-sn-glycerol-3-phosphate acyltransferase